MTTWRKRIHWVPRVWLLAVLLATQGLVLAHGVDHAIEADTSLCAICSVGHGIDKAAATTDAQTLVEPSSHPVESPARSFRPPEPLVTRLARGPPGTL